MYKVYQKIILACLLLVMTGTVYSQRVTQTINDGWKFSLFEGDASTADFDISGWTDVSIPHTWNAKDADDEIPGYFRGKGWYRKVVTVEELIPELNKTAGLHQMAYKLVCALLWVHGKIKRVRVK